MAKTEFLAPPSQEELGDRGVLAVRVGGKKDGKTYRLYADNAKDWKKKVALGESKWNVRINAYIDDPKAFAKDKNLQLLAEIGGPVMEATVWDPSGKESTVLIYARLTDLIYDKDKDRLDPMGQKGMPTFFFHSPEADHGNDNVRGVVQFVEATDGILYYRSYTRPNDQTKYMVLEENKSGPVDVEGNKSYPIWQKMGWSFRIVDYIPHAKRVNDYVPVNIAPGKETQRDKERYPSVVLCRLSADGDKREFWLQKGQVHSNLQVGNRLFSISYSYKETPLGFTLKLERAEKTADPGSNTPASYSSWVRVFDPKGKPEGEEHYITMNQPLEYNGLTFYQSSHEFTGFWDARGKPVSLSGFSVARDPGIMLKYAGSIMLALGISIMFYMKAYFFKARRRPTAAAPTA
jgi:hypothetical protein